MNQWNNIIIHCSDSAFGNALLIDKWHKEKGWVGVGYHFIVQNGYPWTSTDRFGILDGSIEPGRPLDTDPWVEENEVGSHALGYNSNSIGICLIGTDKFQNAQYTTLSLLLKALKGMYPIKEIMGHYQTKSGAEQKKTCPNFDVPKYLQDYKI